MHPSHSDIATMHGKIHIASGVVTEKQFFQDAHHCGLSRITTHECSICDKCGKGKKKPKPY